MFDASGFVFASLSGPLMSIPVLGSIAIICLAIYLFAKETWSIELSSIIIVALLLIFFHIFPVLGENGQNKLGSETLLQGFADPILFAIMALLIVGQGLYHTGALDKPASVLTSLAKINASLAIAAALLAIGFMSAFMNNTPIVVLSIPILTALAMNLDMSTSKLLMPLSFISILGGMTTIIGSSANLLVKAMAEKSGANEIGFFDQTSYGIILAFIGALYVIFLLPRLLGGDEEAKQPRNHSDGNQFISEVTITKGHPWEGLESHAGFFPDLSAISIRMIKREERQLLPPYDGALMVGDVVMFSATRRVLTEAHIQNVQAMDGNQNDKSDRDQSDDDQKKNSRQLSITEAVIAPASRLLGRTVDAETIHAETGCLFVGLQRQARMARQPLRNISFISGDVILLLGTVSEFEQLQGNKNILLVDASAEDLPATQRAPIAMGIFLATILAVATGFLPLAVAAILGATAIVLTGCLNVRQAMRSIDRQVYFLIGCAFAMAAAFDKSGGAQLFASLMTDNFNQLPLFIVASILFLFTAILTNILSNSATAALMTPIILHIAAGLNTPPEFLIYGLIYALNCSFLTPIGYQTNLIIMAPGNYKFKDFLKGGLPLLVLLWVSYTIIAYYHYG